MSRSNKNKLTGLLLPVVVLMAAAIGCSYFTEREGPADTNGSTSNGQAASSPVSDPAGSFAPGGDPKADIEEMADRFLSQKGFRTRLTGIGETPIKMEAEYVAPDRFRIRNENGSETVIIGKDVYMKAGGRWQKMPGDIGASVPDMRKSFDEQSRKWLSDAKYIGEENVNGKETFVYQYHNKGPAGVGENDSKIWIGKADGLPVKIEATYKSGDLKSMLIEYEYDPTISIEPPIK